MNPSILRQVFSKRSALMVVLAIWSANELFTPLTFYSLIAPVILSVAFLKIEEKKFFVLILAAVLAVFWR